MIWSFYTQLWISPIWFQFFLFFTDLTIYSYYYTYKYVVYSSIMMVTCYILTFPEDGDLNWIKWNVVKEQSSGPAVGPNGPALRSRKGRVLCLLIWFLLPVLYLPPSSLLVPFGHSAARIEAACSADWSANSTYLCCRQVPNICPVK